MSLLLRLKTLKWPSRGHFKVCAPNNANSDKERTSDHATRCVIPAATTSPNAARSFAPCRTTWATRTRGTPRTIRASPGASSWGSSNDPPHPHRSRPQHGPLLHDGAAADAVWRMALLKEWGRIGSAGRLVSSRFASKEEAALAMAEHLKAKLSKGYEAV